MQTIGNSRDAALLMRSLIEHSEQEELQLICLDARNRVKATHLCALGTDTEVLISNKIIAKHAIIDMATGVIIGHNHPSGNSLPGKADIESTKRLREALRTLDISLIDHVIIGENEYYSFVDEEKRAL